jgi:catechol 2,3-dioxygenase
METKIAPATTIGEVQLVVADLKRSTQFYQERLGFAVIEERARSEQGYQTVLGAGKRRLVVLNERPGVKPRPPSGGGSRMTGLYHFAVLLPNRRALARLLVHLAEDETEVQGAADHGVSEALYLSDPDGTGIELYSDRRRGEWPVDDLGKLQMGTDELDVDDLVLELKDGLLPWNGLPETTVIGHVHLHVADLAAAERFYTQVLGFQLTQRYGSGAIFVSAGGYHHHIGLNTWAGVGAPPPPADVAGLRWFEVMLPDAETLGAVRGRLGAAGISSEEQEGGFLVQDPSQNGILLRL